MQNNRSEQVGMIRARLTDDERTTRIKLWRDEIRKVSNKQLAEELGSYHEDLISSIVNGEKEPSKQLMKRFCLLMGADVGEIWTFDRNAHAENGEDS